MSDIAIRADGLGKRYRIGAQQAGGRSLRESIYDAARLPVRVLHHSFRDAGAEARRARSETMWALQDVSFEVKAGEAVGIIGKNGAGKSTLLKLLSRITRPTIGHASVNGRVGALLEVGTGFHPELTGRENVYLNGAVLGMHRMDIRKRFDDIVDFAGVGAYLDTPVKHYSSGMYTRLAFAVAAHLEPDILVVDEVLAVGDAEFQKKCLTKMGEAQTEGRTVLFVSHHMPAIQALCKRALWLKDGRLECFDDTAKIVSQYLQAADTGLSIREWGDQRTAPGNDAIRLQSLRVVPRHDSANSITVRTDVDIETQYWKYDPSVEFSLCIQIYNHENVLAFSSIHPLGFPQPAGASSTGLYSTVCHIPGGLLNNGFHRVEVIVIEQPAVAVCRIPGALVFEVADEKDLGTPSWWHGSYIGVVRPQLEWETFVVDQDKSEWQRGA